MNHLAGTKTRYRRDHTAPLAGLISGRAQDIKDSVRDRSGEQGTVGLKQMHLAGRCSGRLEQVCSGRRQCGVKATALAGEFEESGDLIGDRAGTTHSNSEFALTELAFSHGS